MAGKGRAYRDARRITVEAPSGAEFTIRKPSARATTKLLKSYSDTSKLPESIEDIEYMLSDEGMKEAAKEALKERSPEKLEETIETMDALIFNCVVDPKIVAEETDNDDELWVEDIDMPDYFFLSKEIMKLAGVTIEKLRELFRDLGGAIGPTSGDDSDPNAPKT